mmetsp:Transcript_108702/g.325148  ORF Transcript_108702/g.325148 Transcript_108702/m.325148 type:complete len:371 (+) Transcript_108702:601-1713(+)
MRDRLGERQAGRGAVRAYALVEIGLKLPRGGPASEPPVPLGMPVDAHLLCPHHSVVAQIALDRGVAVLAHGVCQEKLPEEVRGVDLVGHVAQAAEVVPGPGPGVSALHNLHEDYVRTVRAACVKGLQHLGADPLPSVLRATVEVGPPLHSVVNGTQPIGIALPIVGVDRVLRPVEGYDGQRPRRIVGLREADPADHCDSRDEAGQLGGQPRTEASTPREARTSDALHVDVESPPHLLQDGPCVADIVGTREVLGLRVTADIEGTIQSLWGRKSKSVLLCHGRHVGHLDERLRRVRGAVSEDPQRDRGVGAVVRGHVDDISPDNAIVNDLDALEPASKSHLWVHRIQEALSCRTSLFVARVPSLGEAQQEP